jgi:hypothetical protein
MIGDREGQTIAGAAVPTRGRRYEMGRGAGGRGGKVNQRTQFVKRCKRCNLNWLGLEYAPIRVCGTNPFRGPWVCAIRTHPW